jgi:hypothetical protein
MGSEGDRRGGEGSVRGWRGGKGKFFLIKITKK